MTKSFLKFFQKFSRRSDKPDSQPKFCPWNLKAMTTPYNYFLTICGNQWNQ